jgi:hypothetical protein
MRVVSEPPSRDILVTIQLAEKNVVLRGEDMSATKKLDNNRTPRRQRKRR